jgi:hypothetical protein
MPATWTARPAAFANRRTRRESMSALRLDAQQDAIDRAMRRTEMYVIMGLAAAFLMLSAAVLALSVLTR